MSHVLLAIVVSLMAHHDTRPPARWIPRPVMTLSEVIVRDTPFRHADRAWGCGCATAVVTWDDSWSGIYGTYHGTELKSWVSSK